MIPDLIMGNTALSRPVILSAAYLIYRHVRYIKFYSHQLVHFFIQLCISLLSYIKITSNTLGSTPTCFDLL